MDTHGNASQSPPQGKHESIWIETSEHTDFDSLDGDITVDVAVVGGGIAGITTATKLKDAGKSVAVVERNRILEDVT